MQLIRFLTQGFLNTHIKYSIPFYFYSIIILLKKYILFLKIKKLISTYDFNN